MNVERIELDKVREKLRSDDQDMLLVCAYEDEDKCRGMLIDGALTLQELKAREHSLGKDHEIVFYCG